MASIPAESISRLEIQLQFYIDNPPTGDGEPDYTGNREEYKNPHWEMVREMKDDSYMASQPGYIAVAILQRVLRGLGSDLTTLGYDTEEEAIDDLETTWDKVKLGTHEAPLMAAVRMARAHPVVFRTHKISPKYQLFLNIGYHMQLMREEDYIVLPVDTLRPILDVSPMRVSDYRSFAQADGFLREIAKAYHSTGGGGIATKFFFSCKVGEDGKMIGGFSPPSVFKDSTPPVENDSFDP